MSLLPQTIPVSEQRVELAYLAMLEDVGERTEAIGDRLIASHWPFVGTDYRRLLVVGQALAGWDDKSSPALWAPDTAATPTGRAAILDATKQWSQKRTEPIDEPLRTRGASPFWGVSKLVAELLEPIGVGPWHRRTAWWNLFPLGWGDTNRSPWFDALWEAQFGHLSALFWEVVDWLDPTRVVILAGQGFWSPTARALGLADLDPLPWPLIAGGVRDGRVLVWTRHPGGHYRGLTRPAFAQAIASAVDHLRRTHNAAVRP
jgi:hypothetical protein